VPSLLIPIVLLIGCFGQVRHPVVGSGFYSWFQIFAAWFPRFPVVSWLFCFCGGPRKWTPAGTGNRNGSVGIKRRIFGYDAPRFGGDPFNRILVRWFEWSTRSPAAFAPAAETTRWRHGCSLRRHCPNDEPAACRWAIVRSRSSPRSVRGSVAMANASSEPRFGCLG
jgi:hypothetical protein